MTDLNMDGRYTVASMPGVAFWLKGYLKEWTEERFVTTCVDESHRHEASCYLCEDLDHEHDAACFLYDEPEEVDNTEFVIAVMVGDDREHIVGVDELTEISEDDYCPGCGQIGCTALKGE